MNRILICNNVKKITTLTRFCLSNLILLFFHTIAFGQSQVTIEAKPIVIPTYQVEPPDKNPIFYTGRNYQGAQGHIYPHPMYDVLTDIKKDKAYNGLFLNNEFLELCIIPELGGRIFSAQDKTNGFDFFYKQHVIKPALIGMIGAWISGGVEWNIPDHHRATSQLPVDYKIEVNADGSKTAWVGETELSRGLKWIVGLTVYPGKSYVEATVKILNCTPFIHSFLYWANVSVHCDENYQVIFPPSTQFGAQHAKGEFTSWPIGSGFYGGMDRTGLDLSWWKNHGNPASIFARNFKDDFLAGYDFAKDAGTVHVANHQVVEGKKFFLWGNNKEAKMWEKMLTETDGQYLELMVGAYSDNQPDYSWIAPGETREFKQYWYPIKKIEGVKNANTEAAVNLVRKTPGSIFVGFQTTSLQKNAKVVIKVNNDALLEETIEISPAKPYLKNLNIDLSVKDTDLKVQLFDSHGNELISYSPVIPIKEEKPSPIETPKSPKEYNTIEELYLTGLRIEQFHNAVIDPLPYYREALRRDSMDYRVNTILGIHYCKDGRFPEAEVHLRRAITRITKNYTHPKDGEAFYYRGVVLAFQNRNSEATDEFWKASWYEGFKSKAYFNLAQLACKDNQYTKALNLIEQSISANSLSAEALTLESYLFRKLGQFEKAKEALNKAGNIDKLDNWTISEANFLDARNIKPVDWSADRLNQFKMHAGNDVQYVLEVAKNYMGIGAYDEAIYILQQFKNFNTEQSSFPLVSYYLGYCYVQLNNTDSARNNFLIAATSPSDYCFPWRLTEIEILKTAAKTNPGDAKAWYYLGNLHYYLNQKEEATKDWEQSVKLDDKFSYAWRNLGFAYNKYSSELKKSLAAYEHAISINAKDPRLFVEIDQVKESLGISPVNRLQYLENYLDVLEKRDDGVMTLISLYNLNGQYDKAIKILTERHFHVWEGNGNIHDIFEDSHVLQGISFLEQKQFSKALVNFQKAATFPANLEIGEPGSLLYNTKLNYFTAKAYEGLGEHTKAVDFYTKSAGYDTQWSNSEIKVYKAMSMKALGKTTESNAIFEQIRSQTLDQLTKDPKNDFFAKFGDDVRKESRDAFNYYIIGLTYEGQGKHKLASENFQKAVDLDPGQLWARFMTQL